jgi:hypothetical protein
MLLYIFGFKDWGGETGKRSKVKGYQLSVIGYRLSVDGKRRVNLGHQKDWPSPLTFNL